MAKFIESRIILIQYAKNNGGKITKKEAIEVIGHLYERIAKNRIGIVLSKMVKNKDLKRIRNGNFEVIPDRETVLQNALRDALELLYECTPPDNLFETYANLIMNYSNLVSEYEKPNTLNDINYKLKNYGKRIITIKTGLDIRAKIVSFL